ncbi:MAG: rhodanese-like domain-containing protein [Proteobacteria bacterium]|nr:rhodanese-like domain-containing protein [Pseudomonadota bacterium]
MKKILILFFCLFVFKSFGFAESYNFIKPEELKRLIESGKRIHLIDVQKEGDFVKKHIKGSVQTDAYPVKSDEDKRKLDYVAEKIKNDNLDVVIVCPRGGGAAKNTYSYLKEKGIAEKRLYILEGGIQGFSYEEVCVKK